MSSVVKMAREVLAMHDRICELEHENYQLRRAVAQHDEFLQETHDHNMRMMGNVMKLVMVPGVVEACNANASEGQA